MAKTFKLKPVKTLKTLNQFVDYAMTLEDVEAYNKELKELPKITDFINYDLDGFEINENVPKFKGWEVDEETSSETKKVAKMVTKNNEYRVYFHTDSGIIISSTTNMSDHVTYNDLAIFFEGKLEMN